MRIVTMVSIDKPIEPVFDFLTTPGNWPRWHPASLAVSGATAPPLEVGEPVTEDYRVAGQSGRCAWTVREWQAPMRWVIDTVAENGNSAKITHRLAREGRFSPRRVPRDHAAAPGSGVE